MPSNACALKEALMITSRINNWFESFGRFQIKHRVAFIVVLEGPDEDGTYGAFKDLSCVRLGATYSF